MGVVSPFRRAALWLGARPWLSRLAPVIVAADRAVDRATHGRFALLWATGLPSLTLTVVGRRSGAPRSVPLLGVPHAGGWVVVGTNWGTETVPAWVLNLRTAGAGVVRVRGIETPVTARETRGAEREARWRELVAVYPNFARYAAHTRRELPVVVLTPTSVGHP